MISISSETAYATFIIVNSNLGLSFTVSEIQSLIAWNFTLKIAAKPLQIETWLQLRAYKKLPAPYLIVPLSTPYNRLATIPHDWHTIVRFTLQDHARSMIYMLFKSQYATSYKCSIAT